VISDPDVIGLLYLVTIICFVLALRFLSSPKHARKGNWVGGAGMLVAIATTLALEGIGNWALIVIGGLVGSVVGVVGARKVKMTAMPQMVALFNGVGGGAAALVALSEFHVSSGGMATDAIDRRCCPPDRLDLLRGLGSSFREAAGARQRPADRLPGAERRQHDRPARGGRPRDRCDRRRRGGVGADRAHRPRTRLRRHVRAPHRWRGHAGRDLVAERIHRPRGVCDRFRP
jgi:hypothetical protein